MLLWLAGPIKLGKWQLFGDFCRGKARLKRLLWLDGPKFSPSRVRSVFTEESGE